jgi:hypothetical protein
VVLGHAPVIKPELFGENALPNLINQNALITGMHVLQRAFKDDHALGGVVGRQIGCAIVKYAYLDHVRGLPIRAEITPYPSD